MSRNILPQSPAIEDVGIDFGDAVGASGNASPEPLGNGGGDLLALLQRSASSKSRACIPCRQLKKRCGTERPCRSCISRGVADSCVDDIKPAACLQCRSRRLKCDRQRPCSRCVQLGRGDSCTATPRLINEPDDVQPVDPGLWQTESGDTYDIGPNKDPSTSGCNSSAALVPAGEIVGHVHRPLPNVLGMMFSHAADAQDEVHRVIHSLSLVYGYGDDDDIGNPVLRWFEAGWHPTDVARCIGQLPRDLRIEMDAGMTALHEIQKLVVALKGAGSQRDSQRARLTREHQPALPMSLGHNKANENGRRSEVQDAAPVHGRKRPWDDWEHSGQSEEEALAQHIRELKVKHGLSENTAFVLFEWDPNTGRRKAAHLSPNIAQYLDMHSDELLARLGNREHMLLNTDLEFFSRAVAELFGDEERAPGQSHVNDSISRMVISDPKTRKMKRQLLVRCVGVREADRTGRLVRSVNFIDKVSPDEVNDMGGRYMLTEDARTGEELLADSGKDYLFDETWSGISDNPSRIQAIKSALRKKAQRLQVTASQLRQSLHQRQLDQTMSGAGGSYSSLVKLVGDKQACRH